MLRSRYQDVQCDKHYLRQDDFIFKVAIFRQELTRTYFKFAQPG